MDRLQRITRAAQIRHTWPYAAAPGHGLLLQQVVLLGENVKACSNQILVLFYDFGRQCCAMDVL
jgi:hypothetical protein